MNILKEIESIEGWLSYEVATLLYQSVKESPEGCIVEIGSWKGKSTVCLASASTSKTVYAIDPFTGSQEHKHLYGNDISTFKEFHSNLIRFNVDDRVVPLIMTSFEAKDKIKEPISLLWIDGSHDFVDVLQDFKIWFPRVRPGGYILFHDSKWQGVKKVLLEYFMADPLTGLVRRVEDTTFAKKLAKPNKSFREVNLNLIELELKKQKLKSLKRRLNRWLKRNKPPIS